MCKIVKKRFYLKKDSNAETGIFKNMKILIFSIAKTFFFPEIYTLKIIMHFLDMRKNF